jgi:hypothetical protein
MFDQTSAVKLIHLQDFYDQREVSKVEGKTNFIYTERSDFNPSNDPHH